MIGRVPWLIAWFVRMGEGFPSYLTTVSQCHVLGWTLRYSKLNRRYLQ